LTKSPKTYNGEKTASSTNVAWKTVYLHAENCISACGKLKLDTCLSPCTSINSKWIKELSIRPETLKLVQKRLGNTLEAVGIHNDFLSKTQLAQQLRERINKWDFMKLKNFFTTKEMIYKLKRPPTEWEKIFTSYTSDRKLITRICWELKKLNSHKINEEMGN
jgi:hypothetical protein